MIIVIVIVEKKTQLDIRNGFVTLNQTCAWNWTSYGDDAVHILWGGNVPQVKLSYLTCAWSWISYADDALHILRRVHAPEAKWSYLSCAWSWTSYADDALCIMWGVHVPQAKCSFLWWRHKLSRINGKTVHFKEHQHLQWTDNCELKG